MYHSRIFIVFVTMLIFHLFYSIHALRIHIMPHSHIDQGWLQTVDGYQPTVFQILESVLRELNSNVNRTFVWGEVLYFRRWFEGLKEDKQTQVKNLIQNNRFEFACGGWVENDYASVSYQSVIEQMTLGYEYLRERFGIIPRFGFDIDPFGYSSHVASLYSQMGLEMVVLNRVHWKIKEAMRKTRNLEFLWLTDKELKIFTHVLHTHYSAPSGFDFENPGVFEVNNGNVKSRAAQFMNAMKSRADSYRTDVLLIPWGDDFKFRNAAKQYKSMDLLISFINENYPDTKIKYSTVSNYFDELQHESKEKDIQYAVVNQDFLPYADNDDSYWTGHFTTLPNLKKNIRIAEAGVRTADKLLTYVNQIKHDQMNTNDLGKTIYSSIYSMKENLSILYHHDAITGTCKRVAANDYIKRATSIIKQSKDVQSKLLEILLDKKDKSFVEIASFEANDKDSYEIAIINPTSHQRAEIIQIQSSTLNLKISDSKGTNLPIISSRKIIDNDFKLVLSEIKYILYIKVNVDAFSTNILNIQPDSISKAGTSDMYCITSNNIDKTLFKKISSRARKIEIHNQKYTIRILQNGNIAFVQNNDSKIKHKFEGPQFSFFSTQRSGSYLFRPSAIAAPLNDNNPSYIIKVENPLFEEIYVFGSKIKQRIRLLKDNSIPLSNYFQHFLYVEKLNGNTELMNNYYISDKRSSLITWDGVQFTPRFVNGNIPIAAKFYPAINGAMCRGENYQISVINQESMGVTHSVDNKSISFMIHRRLMRDDGRGMGEGNNDESTLATQFLISYDSVKNIDEEKVLDFQKKTFDWNHPLALFAREIDPSSIVTKNKYNLPSILNPKFKGESFTEILSLDQRGGSNSNGETILRIHNLRNSKPIKIDVSSLFHPAFASVTSAIQTTLNLAYRIPDDIEQFQTKFKEEDKRTVFDFMSKDISKKSLEAQNSQEQGVFLSDAALEHSDTTIRKPKANKLLRIEILPRQIATVILQLDSPTNMEDHSEDMNQTEQTIQEVQIQSSTSASPSTSTSASTPTPISTPNTIPSDLNNSPSISREDISYDQAYIPFKDIKLAEPQKGKISNLFKGYSTNDGLNTSNHLIFYIFFTIFCTIVAISFLFFVIQRRMRRDWRNDTIIPLHNDPPIHAGHTTLTTVENDKDV